jgi:hypothetical protein
MARVTARVMGMARAMTVTVTVGVSVRTLSAGGTA